MQYHVGSGYSYIAFSGTSANGTDFWAGTPADNIICTVSGSYLSFPACSTWHIVVDRAGGVITFTNTPVFKKLSYELGTMNGSLTFPAF